MGLAAGTPRSADSAGGTASGAIRSTYESKAKPIAAMVAMTHCSAVNRAGAASSDGAASDDTVAMTRQSSWFLGGSCLAVGGEQPPITIGGVVRTTPVRRNTTSIYFTRSGKAEDDLHHMQISSSPTNAADLAARAAASRDA